MVPNEPDASSLCPDCLCLAVAPFHLPDLAKPPVLFLCLAEKMITSEALEGVPILVLANKQDVEVRLAQIYLSELCLHI